jgi:hypothetical protein
MTTPTTSPIEADLGVSVLHELAFSSDSIKEGRVDACWRLETAADHLLIMNRSAFDMPTPIDKALCIDSRVKKHEDIFLSFFPLCQMVQGMKTFMKKEDKGTLTLADTMCWNEGLVFNWGND